MKSGVASICILSRRSKKKGEKRGSGGARRGVEGNKKRGGPTSLVVWGPGEPDDVSEGSSYYDKSGSITRPTYDKFTS